MAQLRTQIILLICIILQGKAASVRRKSNIVPPVSDVRTLVSSDDGDILVTWQYPEHLAVSSFIVTWDMIGQEESSGTAKRIKDEIVAWIKGEKPEKNVLVLDVSQRSVLLKNTTTSGSSSGLQVCVTTKSKKNLGQLICSSLTSVDSSHVLPAPLNLHWTDVGLPGLIWEPVEGADSYLLQWKEYNQELDELTGAVGDYSYSTGFSFRFDNGLTPGFWHIIVRAINGHKLGEPATYYKEISGVSIHLNQIGKTNVRLRWRVFPQEPTQQNVTHTYDIIASQEVGYKVMILDFECSPLLNNCETVITGVKFMTNRVITVTVQGTKPTKLPQAHATLKLITLPPSPSNLKLLMRKSSGATIIWNCIETSVPFYIVSIRKNSSRTRVRRNTSKIPPCSLALGQDDDVEGALVEIEACLDLQHCSSPASLILKLKEINTNELRKENIGPIFSTFIVITIMLILFTLVIMYVKKQTKNESINEADTMCYGGKNKILYGHNE